MRIEYDYTREDFIRFNMYHMFNYDKTAKKRLAWSKYVTALIILAMGAAIPNFMGVQNIAYWSLYLVAAIIWILAYPKYVQGKLEKRVNKVLDNEKNKVGIGWQSLDVSEGFLFNTTSKAKMKVRWEDVADIVENRDYIFIYTAADDAVAVPKIIFSTKEEESSFVSDIKGFWIAGKAKATKSVPAGAQGAKTESAEA
jgi:hypothetical protein